MYDWVQTEIPLEDKPDKEQINNDLLFDAWLENYERKVQQRNLQHLHNVRKQSLGV